MLIVSKLPLSMPQSQFVLMPQTGVSIVVVFLMNVVLPPLIMPSSWLVMTQMLGSSKTHGTLHGVKMVTSDLKEAILVVLLNMLWLPTSD